MKKFIALILALVMILSVLALVSCGDNPQKAETSDTTSASAVGVDETTKGTDGGFSERNNDNENDGNDLHDKRRGDDRLRNRADRQGKASRFQRCQLRRQNIPFCHAEGLERRLGLL